jgi:hypothetical protein
VAGNESLLLHHRRVLTLQSQGADERESELGGVYRQIRDDVAGTPLPDSMPHRAEVLAAGYSAVEDLQDATEDELARRGLSRRQARAVIAALKAAQEA